MPTPICSKCKEHLVKYQKFHDWWKLYCFVNFLESQGDITIETRDEITDVLMTFKQYAFEEWDTMVATLVDIAYKPIIEGEKEIDVINRFRTMADHALTVCDLGKIEGKDDE